jgi:predicted N-acyltransferase
VGQRHLCFAPGVDPLPVLNFLDKILQEVAKKEKIHFIVYKEFDPKMCRLMDSLKTIGYRCADSLYNNYFRDKFSNFTDYASALNSHYRQDIKRSLKKFQNAGLTVLRLQDPESIRSKYTPEIHKYYEAVATKAEVRLELLPIDFFHDLARQFPDQVSLTLICRQNEIVAFNWGLYSPTSYSAE